mmetsp:Transcript_19816/g.46074  ORF Transcript_19816/g.46074 Transcript_19816/m.46074 type:complete len:122 (+) Transcript_19816:656-1021(+)
MAGTGRGGVILSAASSLLCLERERERDDEGVERKDRERDRGRGCLLLPRDLCAAPHSASCSVSLHELNLTLLLLRKGTLCHCCLHGGGILPGYWLELEWIHSSDAAEGLDSTILSATLRRC